MDCQSFDSSLLDAIYDEVDGPTASAMDEHAAGCAACAARAARFERTHEHVRRALEASPPVGLEARILAAADAASATSVPTSTTSKAIVTSLAERRAFGVFAKPQFAIAATVLLAVGGGAVLLRGAGKPAPLVASESAPAVTAGAGAPAAAASAASALALAEPAAPPPAPVTMAAKSQANDASFEKSKTLHDAGKYADAAAVRAGPAAPAATRPPAAAPITKSKVDVAY